MDSRLTRKPRIELRGPSWQGGSFRYIGLMLPATLSQVPSTRPRRILVVGGLARLEPHYRRCIDDLQIDVANENSARLRHSVTAADAILVLVTHISHAAVERVRREAERHGIPVAHSWSSGVSEVKRSIYALLTSASAA